MPLDSRSIGLVILMDNMLSGPLILLLFKWRYLGICISYFGYASDMRICLSCPTLGQCRRFMTTVICHEKMVHGLFNWTRHRWPQTHVSKGDLKCRHGSLKKMGDRRSKLLGKGGCGCGVSSVYMKMVTSRNWSEKYKAWLTL